MESKLNPVELFHQTARAIPAYKKILAKRGFNPNRIKTVSSIEQIPIIDKKSYLAQSNLKELFPKNHLPPVAYASSGSSGSPSFWFRGSQQEILGAKAHAKILSDVWNIKKTDSTLVIVTFSMGVWVAGNFTAVCFKEAAEQFGYNLTVATPGLEKQDIFWCLRKLAPQFKNVIIAGYPPFVMDVLNEVKEQNIALPTRLKILTAGDTFSESWRVECLRFIKSKNISDVLNIYGSADTGLLGFETPLSIAIRKLAIKNKELGIEIFGKPIQSTPALVQYDPSSVYFENYEDELIITVPTASPLVRYNIHDQGKVLSIIDVKKLLQRNGLLTQTLKKLIAKFPLPFIVKTGRTDVAVTFYALNIYPEHIKAGLEKSKNKPHVSGNFFAYTKDSTNHKRQNLYFNVELNSNKNIPEKLSKQIKERLIDTLLKVNIEFRKLHSVLGEKAIPNINFYPKNHKIFDQAKGLVTLKGKKPKIVF